MSPREDFHPSDPSGPSDEPLLPKHGGYRKLKSFQASLDVYHGTLVFCGRFIDRRSRTHDQMVQAARSAPRNISEGSMASGTSKKIELKLTGIAAASLEELMGDYEDFLSHQGLCQWNKDHPKAVAARARLQKGGSIRAEVSRASAEDAANLMLCLVNQASYLIKRQVRRLEEDFKVHGGVTERLYRIRSAVRERSEAHPATPSCPLCHHPMRRRLARKGPHSGKPFWGCSRYPDCNGIKSSDQSNQSDQSD